jgi:hypothetical protein
MHLNLLEQGLKELLVLGNFLYDNPAAGIYLGDTPIVGQLSQNRNAFAVAVISDPGVAQVGPIDKDAQREV